MPRLWFDPVEVWITDSTRRTVTSVEEAARLLIDEWPDPDDTCDARLFAMETCHAALKARTPKTIDIARSAFIEAAREARMI
ncbi:DUF982 domain-containing protein [Chelatococcus sp.]|uniref:DUF982 domain-containing protein n=1 Tax=Chelatococcus sp. TaxID=1953771 RepID=UPI003448DA06